MMRVVTPQQALSLCQRALNAPNGEDPQHDDVVSSALRRGVSLLAPCSFADLIRFVEEPLRTLGISRDAVEQLLDEMIAYGEIFEMRRLAGDPWDAPPYVLRPAPPSFVVRASGEIVVLGGSGDHASPLPAELASSIRIEGTLRILPTASEELVENLKLLGLIQLSENAWLRSPPATSAQDFIATWRAKLREVRAGPANIEGLEILDPSRPTRFYNGRWRSLSQQDDGMYVARRPQAYGMRLWSTVEVEAGTVIRLLDLYATDQFQRPCDIAWRLQAAIDAAADHPQAVVVRDLGDLCSFEFRAPLPAFAERRLALVGRKVPAQGALFSFQLQKARVSQELEVLSETLWTRPTYEGGAS